MADKFLYNNGGRPAEKEAKVSSAGASDAGKIVALDADGRLNLTVMPSGVGPSTVSIVASESLVSGALVNIWDNLGTPNIRNADATTNGKPAHGYVTGAYSALQTATVYLSGQNTAVTGRTPGKTQYLSTTPGQMTETAPSASGNLVQMIGPAANATTVRFQPQEICTVA